MDDIQTARYDLVFDGHELGDDYLSRDSFTRHTRTLAQLPGQDPESTTIAAFGEEPGNGSDRLVATLKQITTAAYLATNGGIQRHLSQILDRFRPTPQRTARSARRPCQIVQPSSSANWNVSSMRRSGVAMSAR